MLTLRGLSLSIKSIVIERCVMYQIHEFSGLSYSPVTKFVNLENLQEVHWMNKYLHLPLQLLPSLLLDLLLAIDVFKNKHVESDKLILIQGQVLSTPSGHS